MSRLFMMSMAGVLAMVPIHFLSVEHHRLDSRLGEARGKKVGSALGMISGWGIFLFYFGVWFSPQPRFGPLFIDQTVSIPLFLLPPLEIPLLHLGIGSCALVIGAYLGIKGVMDMGLKTAETHRPEEITRTGIYGRIRHPQYTGAVFSHLGVTFLLSAWFSLLVTLPIIAVNYILCWKEEQELAREFGEDYRAYQKDVPMFLPSRRG